MYKPAIVTGIITAMLAVVTGAFGAHGLKSVLSNGPDVMDAAGLLAVFEKGVTYQFYHSFALIAAGILHISFPYKAIRLAPWLFAIGILLFSGSLYLMVALKIAGGSIGSAGIITPVGGLCFIAGWLALLAGVLKKK